MITLILLNFELEKVRILSSSFVDQPINFARTYNHVWTWPNSIELFLVGSQIILAFLL